MILRFHVISLTRGWRYISSKCSLFSKKKIFLGFFFFFKGNYPELLLTLSFSETAYFFLATVRHWLSSSVTYGKTRVMWLVNPIITRLCWPGLADTDKNISNLCAICLSNGGHPSLEILSLEHLLSLKWWILTHQQLLLSFIAF